MQLYAWDRTGRWIAVERAQRGVDYYCPECRGALRVREGELRQRHYYHRAEGGGCRQSGKGLYHLQSQRYVVAGLPLGEGAMEVRFAGIGRIADVAWEARHIVFEIQCAAMDPREARQRTDDYRSVGWQVIWLLHTIRYGQERLTPLEDALTSTPHYFINVDEKGQGSIYDQVAVSALRKRQVMTARQSVQLRLAEIPSQVAYKLPQVVQDRLTHWPVRLVGDYLDRLAESDLWKPLLAAERRGRYSLSLWHIFWYRLFIRPTNLWIQYLLERHSLR